jgi:hypothetical protein
LILFFVGLVEMFIAALAVQMIVKERTVFAGVVTFVSVWIWCFLVRAISTQGYLEILCYAFGCMSGTMLKIQITKIKRGLLGKVP